MAVHWAINLPGPFMWIKRFTERGQRVKRGLFYWLFALWAVELLCITVVFTAWLGWALIVLTVRALGLVAKGASNGQR